MWRKFSVYHACARLRNKPGSSVVVPTTSWMDGICESREKEKSFGSIWELWDLVSSLSVPLVVPSHNCRSWTRWGISRGTFKSCLRGKCCWGLPWSCVKTKWIGGICFCSSTLKEPSHGVTLRFKSCCMILGCIRKRWTSACMGWKIMFRVNPIGKELESWSTVRVLRKGWEPCVTGLMNTNMSWGVWKPKWDGKHDLGWLKRTPPNLCRPWSKGWRMMKRAGNRAWWHTLSSQLRAWKPMMKRKLWGFSRDVMKTWDIRQTRGLFPCWKLHVQAKHVWNLRRVSRAAHVKK